MQRKSLLGLSATVVIIAAIIMSIGVSMETYDQNTTVPQASNTSHPGTGQW